MSGLHHQHQGKQAGGNGLGPAEVEQPTLGGENSVKGQIGAHRISDTPVLDLAEKGQDGEPVNPNLVALDGAVAVGDYKAASKAIGRLTAPERGLLSVDDSLYKRIANTFTLKQCITLLDSAGANTPGLLMRLTSQAFMAAVGTDPKDKTLVALVKRHSLGVLALVGVVPYPALGALYEATRTSPVPAMSTWTPGAQLDTLKGMGKVYARDTLVALQGAGAYDTFTKGLNEKQAVELGSLLPEQDLTEKQLEKMAKKSANPERALAAVNELKTLQAVDPKGRLTDGILNLLAWGVATASTNKSVGREGLIGIHHAVNAAEALIAMPLPMYSGIVGKLAMAGSIDKESSRQVESVLILKAVGARKKDFIAGKDEASQAVAQFAEDVRGMDSDELKEKTSLRDRGNKKGLQQKFTMSCGPTSIQITHGESDPIYAKKVSEDAKHDLNYNSDTANQQKAYLNKSTVPREVMNSWKSFQVKLEKWAKKNENVMPAIELEDWIQGLPCNEVDRAKAVTWANGAGFTNDRLNEFKTHFPFNEPGWQNSEFESKANSELKNATNAKFDELAIPPTWTAVAGKNRPFSTVTEANCDVLYDALFRGKDVPVGVMWYGGGGHFMVFTDCKKEKDKRSFLLSDPWEGTSEWLSEKDVRAGKFGSHGTGAVDSIYL